MPLFGGKFSIALFIFLLAVIAGLYPFLKKNKQVLDVQFSAADALAGGIFFGAGLLHMLGTATSNFISLGFIYPWPFLISGGVFLLLLYYEHLGNLAEQSYTNKKIFVFLPLIMICLHSLFEGTALGLSSQIALTIVIAGAIIAHKWAASFALAVQLNRNEQNNKVAFILFLIFCCMTPIGILLGNVIQQQLSQFKLMESICDALAAGTFLYLGSIHGLRRGTKVGCSYFNNFHYMLLGFITMAIVAVWL